MEICVKHDMKVNNYIVHTIAENLVIRCIEDAGPSFMCSR
jgi:hypothetical protein